MKNPILFDSGVVDASRLYAIHFEPALREGGGWLNYFRQASLWLDAPSHEQVVVVVPNDKQQNGAAISRLEAYAKAQMTVVPHPPASGMPPYGWAIDLDKLFMCSFESREGRIAKAIMRFAIGEPEHCIYVDIEDGIGAASLKAVFSKGLAPL